MPDTVFAILALFSPQNGTIPPSPFDEVFELELTDASPSATAEYFVDFEGTLHVWTRSELDLSVQVEDVDAEEIVGTDEDSGGGTTPYLRLQVELNDELAITVTSADDAAVGPLELHVVAAPETDATRGAARAARERLTEAQRLQAQDELEPARAAVNAALDRLLNAEGARHSEAVARVAWDLGFVARRLGNLTTCQSAWGAAREHRERTLPEDHPALLAARANLAVSMMEQGALPGAIALQEAVLAAYERTLPEDHPELLRARENLAATISEQGDLPAARVLFEAVLAARERTLPEDHPDLLRARAHLATTISAQDDLPGARALQEAVLAGYERTLPEDHPELLVARANLASTIKQQGDLHGARALQEAVLAAYERTLPEDHPELLRARANLANTILGQGDLPAARALQEAVLAAYERTLPEDYLRLLRARANLAATIWQQDDLPGARALQEAVLAGYERTLPEDHPDLLAARANLAATINKQGDHSGARALQEAVLAAYERTLLEDHPDLLRARAHLASTIYTQGDFSAARVLQEAVLAARERTLPEDHQGLLRARANLAATIWEQGDFPGARALLPDLLARMRARVLGSLALAPREARETVEAESHRLNSLLFLSRLADSSLRTPVFELQETMRVVALEAARALRGASDPEVGALMGEARSVRAALNDLVSGSNEARDADELSAELTRLMQERDRLERGASQLLAERGVATQPVDIGSLGRSLGTDGAAVAYRRVAHWYADEQAGRVLVGEDHLLAHVLRPDRSLARIDLGAASELEELVVAWRLATGVPLLRGARVEDPEGDSEGALGARLRERLLDPVLAALAESTQRLFVCADDLVFLVPLDALPYEGGRVGDRWEIVNEVSYARLMMPRGPLDTTPGLFALGGVDYDAGGDGPVVDAGASSSRSAMPDRFARLLQTRFEAQTAGMLFEELCEAEPVIVTKAEATKAALFEHAPGKRYLHLATHGWFASEAIRSTADADADRGTEGGWARMSVQERVTGMAPMLLCGLALAGANNGRDSLGRMNGILTAEELCSLDLSACDLAVLSACETNVGIRRAGQGIQSLQAALYAAGARSSITSLWKVDDAATRQLMEHFYTNLWEAEMGKAEALWAAKRVLREAGAPVRDWAGWVLTGDPD